MSGIHGVSRTGSMPQNCGMQGMHESSRVKKPDETQAEAKRQTNVAQGKIPSEILGNKIDIKI